MISHNNYRDVRKVYFKANNFVSLWHQEKLDFAHILFFGGRLRGCFTERFFC